MASLSSLLIEEPKEVPLFQSCVIPKIESTHDGKTAINFYNYCHEKIYINACVLGPDGESKLYKSFRAIPVGGKFTIHTFSTVKLSDLHWIADLTDPGMPPECSR